MTFTADELTRTDVTLERLGDLESGARRAVTFAFDRTVVRVRFADAEAARLHASRYRHMLSSASPTVTFHVAARDRATYFWSSTGAAYRWDRRALAPHEIAFLADAVTTTHVFSSLPDSFALHAGAVGGAAGVAAIVGTTEAGKTTTSLACTRRGLRLLSDEFCVVTPRGVVPFPRTLNLRRGGIDLLLADGASPSALADWLHAHRGGDRHDVGFDELFAAWQPPAPGPLRTLFLATGRDRRAAARRSSAARMLPQLLPWTRMSARGLEAAGALLSFLQGVECYELTLGPPDASAELIARTLADAASARSSATGNERAFDAE